MQQFNAVAVSNEHFAGLARKARVALKAGRRAGEDTEDTEAPVGASDYYDTPADLSARHARCGRGRSVVVY